MGGVGVPAFTLKESAQKLYHEFSVGYGEYLPYQVSQSNNLSVVVLFCIKINDTSSPTQVKHIAMSWDDV